MRKTERKSLRASGRSPEERPKWRPKWIRKFIRILRREGIAIRKDDATERYTDLSPTDYCWSFRLRDPIRNHHDTYTQYWERWAEEADVRLLVFDYRIRATYARVDLIVGRRRKES